MTTSGQIDRTAARLRAQTDAIARFTDQITSGLRIARPSDGPAEFAAVTAGRALTARLGTHLESINVATATLDEGNGALQGINQILNRASELALTAADASTDPISYGMLATELDRLIESALGLANTRSDGRYVFGGTRTDAAPFEVTATDAQGRTAAIEYRGSSASGRATVGPNQTVEIFQPGEAAFGPTADVFATLIGLRDEIRAGGSDQNAFAASIRTRIGELETARERVLGSLGDRSADLSRLQTLKSRSEDLRLSTRIRTTDLEGTDFAETVIRLQETQVLLQATLGVTATLFDTRILDLIR